MAGNSSNSNGDDGLRRAAQRSSDLMGSYAARRKAASGADAAEPRRDEGESSARAVARRSSDLMSSYASTRRGAPDSASRDSGEGGRAPREEPARTSRADRDGLRRSGGSRSGDSRAARGRGGEGGRGSHARPETLASFIRRNIVFVLGVVAVVALAVVLIAILRQFMPSAGSEAADPAGSAEAMPASVKVAEEQEQGAAEVLGKGAGAQNGAVYDWSALDSTEGRLAYVVDGKTLSRFGIDVSDHQGAIDWDAVASEGVQFAIIRVGYRGATEGGLYLDEQFDANLAGAKEAGIACGVYFFSQARSTQEAVEEADFVLEHLGGAQLEYPVVYDCEVEIDGVDQVRNADLSSDEMTAVAEAFFERVSSAGFDTMLYGNWRDLLRYNEDFVQKNKVWWAEYQRTEPSVSTGFSMWQYSYSGVIAGIEGATDLNLDLTGVA